MYAIRSYYVSDDNMPYVLPMNFALEGDTVILHSAQEGRMWETIKKNPQVCINWTLGEELAWQDVQVGCVITSYSIHYTKLYDLRVYRE